MSATSSHRLLITRFSHACEPPSTPVSLPRSTRHVPRSAGRSIPLPPRSRQCPGRVRYWSRSSVATTSHWPSAMCREGGNRARSSRPRTPQPSNGKRRDPHVGEFRVAPSQRGSGARDDGQRSAGQVRREYHDAHFRRAIKSLAHAQSSAVGTSSNSGRSSLPSWSGSPFTPYRTIGTDGIQTAPFFAHQALHVPPRRWSQSAGLVAVQ